MGKLAVRLNAKRRLPGFRWSPVTASIAAAVLRRHRPGTLTLVVMNTVAAARGVHVALRKESVPLTLLHSRFRGIERERLAEASVPSLRSAGHVVVATQVVEAGLDLDAAVLVTERFRGRRWCSGRGGVTGGVC